MNTPVIVFLLLKNYVILIGMLAWFLFLKIKTVIVLSLKSVYIHKKINYNIFWPIEQD